MARAYSITEAKTKFTEILRLVKSGKEIIVNERGQPIAKILPCDSSNLSLEARLRELHISGQIISATRAPYFFPGKKKAGVLLRFLRSRD